MNLPGVLANKHGSRRKRKRRTWLTNQVVDVLLSLLHAGHILGQGGQLVGRLAGVEAQQLQQAAAAAKRRRKKALNASKGRSGAAAATGGGSSCM